MDDFYIKMILVEAFVAIFQDAMKRKDWTYLDMFIKSELAKPAFKMWRWMDRNSYDAFGRIIEAAKNANAR